MGSSGPHEKRRPGLRQLAERRSARTERLLWACGPLAAFSFVAAVLAFAVAAFGERTALLSYRLAEAKARPAIEEPALVPETVPEAPSAATPAPATPADPVSVFAAAITERDERIRRLQERLDACERKGTQ